MKSALKHQVVIQRGYYRIDTIWHNPDGTTKVEPGGWVDDPEHGRLYFAACSCGNQALGWSEREVRDRLHDAKYERGVAK